MTSYRKLLAIVLLTSLLITSAVLAEDCSHTFLPTASPIYRAGSIIAYTIDGHVYYFEVLTVCCACGEENWSRADPALKPNGTYPHNYSVRLKDRGHSSAAENLHVYEYGCSNPNCPYTIDLEVFCDSFCASSINKKPSDIDTE